MLVASPLPPLSLKSVSLPEFLCGYIRPAEKFTGGGVQIDKVVVSYKAEENLELDRWTFNNFSVLYAGKSSHADRHIVQHRFMRC